MSKQTARLDGWSDMGTHFTGHVSGHPRFQDGTYIYTSYVVYRAIEDNWIETLNTHYVLGDSFEEQLKEAGLTLVFE